MDNLSRFMDKNKYITLIYIVMTKPYCGIESKVPKGYHRATMQECIDNKQVQNR